MNTNHATATLSPRQLADKISELIDYHEIIQLVIDQQYDKHGIKTALRLSDGIQAELLNYFTDQARLAGQGDSVDQGIKTPAPTETPVDYLDLLNDAGRAYGNAEALCTAIIMSREDEGFYALRHDLSHAYIASIHAELGQMKKVVDGLSALVREAC